VNRVDRDLVERLLRDGHSGRSAARIAGCSEWSARRIKRAMVGDERPLKNTHRARDDHSDEAWGLGGWAVLVAFIAILSGVIWAASRRRRGSVS
jgi:hypothetical protein